MNILTHPVHTPYQFDLAKTGHQFYSIPIPWSGEVFWDYHSRPKPPNFHCLKSLWGSRIKFDLVLAHDSLGFDLLKSVDVPVIFKEHCIRAAFHVPKHWLERVSLYSFASETAASRWVMPPGHRHQKRIIGMGIDCQSFHGYTGALKKVLVVGHSIRGRGAEKGYANLKALAGKFGMTIVGRRNEGLCGAIGPAANFSNLKLQYKAHRVYLNPSRLLDLSTLEAMATGMPVVMFRPVNSDLVQDGVHGYIVDSARDASRAITCLLRDKCLARKLGQNARSLIETRFRPEAFAARWNSLFMETSRGQKPQPAWNVLEPFTSDAKISRRLVGVVESLLRNAFNYRRMGYDSRKMTFLRNGYVGIGRAGCEVFWRVFDEGEYTYLDICSASTLTCRLQWQQNGTWIGYWENFERMAIILSPRSAQVGRDSTHYNLRRASQKEKPCPL